MEIFRDLCEDEKEEFKEWARTHETWANYDKVGSYHPVIIDEWIKLGWINKESECPAGRTSPRRMGWIIIEDVINNQFKDEPDEVEADSYDNRLEFPHMFRVFDDDDNIYYYGRLHKKYDPSSEDGFIPLDYYMNDSGCTKSEYWFDSKNCWEVL